MNIIFAGKFLPQKLINKTLADNKSKIGLSNHNFEQSIIDGLCQQNNVSHNCITVPGVFSYPYNNPYFFTKRESYSYKTTKITSARFCNLPIIKEIWGILSCSIELYQYVRKNRASTTHLLINTPDIRILAAVQLLKLFTKNNLSQTVIIPDLPAMLLSMDNQKGLKAAILHFLNRIINILLSKCDGFVLLTESMTDFLPSGVPYIVMEGLINSDSSYTLSESFHPEKEIILYTGTLREIFGVRDLVDAFKLITNNNVELWICGSGDSQSYIEAAAQIDSRIKFYGLVDGETARKLQREATILVNPRTSRGEYTKYSFPSKTLEYMLCGKSVVMHKLPGVPDEYYEYVFSPVEESILSLKECLEEVLSMNPSYRKNKAAAGRNFVISNKNAQKQVSRIIDFIKSY